MGRRGRADALDLACREWARQRRVVLGLEPTLHAHSCIGPLSCTLDKIRRLHANAALLSSGGFTVEQSQHWPEVYTDGALDVARAYHAMPSDLRQILDVHYVLSGLVTMKADRLALSPRSYFNRLAASRHFLEGFMASTAREIKCAV